MHGKVWDDLARKLPRDPVTDPRPWDDDGLLELRAIALTGPVAMARALAPVLVESRLAGRVFAPVRSGGYEP